MVKISRKVSEEREAIRELANEVQTLRDELLLANIYQTALVELLTEGRAITSESVEKRRRQVFEACQQEWAKLQASE